MSASPDAGAEARKRKRMRSSEPEDQQVQYQDGVGQYRASASHAGNGSRATPPTPMHPVNSTSDGREAHYDPAAAGRSASPGATGQQAQRASSSGPPSARSSVPPDGPQHRMSEQPHAQASRPAKFDRRDRILNKDTLEHSYFVVEPNDEFTREVGDWIWGWICNRGNVEIEGKIGLLVDSRPGIPPKTRVSYPLATETILTDTTFARFESNMTLRQHHHFNMILNERASEAARPNYSGAPIRYVHTREIDAFYVAPPSSNAGGPGGGKTRLRVTRDQKTGQVKNDPKASVQKSRIADMNIYSPKRGFDFRISVSVEEPVPLPTTKSTHERWKDRVSYQHQAFQIDLTQVRAPDGGPTLHELEIEFSDMPLLMQEGEKAYRGEESLYFDMVQVFLNNIRMLIRNASPP